MTHEEFESLVAGLEDKAREDPAGYRRSVILFAFLGNAYLAFMLALIAAMFIGALASIMVLKVVGVKIAVLLGIFLWMVLRALNIRLTPPEGAELNRDQAPSLFAMIDELRGQLGAPVFHHVLVTDAFNAGVAQVPRLGIFGVPSNYLLVGLPLMKALTVDQFKAVLAHEFGHLARGHGRMSNWIYRQRLRWARLIDSLESEQSSGSFLFKPFLRWYAPHFNAYSFPLARANEYEADATAARLTSPHVAAQALTNVEVMGMYLGEQFWPGIHKQAEEVATPAFGPFAGMGARFAADFDGTDAAARIERALARKTTTADTHPALCDRLQALGQPAQLIRPDPQNASDRLLGDVLPVLTQSFDGRWRDLVLPSWQERFRRTQESRNRLASLDATAARGEALSIDEACERALLAAVVGGNEETCIEQLRALVQQAPEHAKAHYWLGVRLLMRDDPAGRSLLERAAALDDSAMPSALEAVRDFLVRTGHPEEAKQVNARLEDCVWAEREAADERNRLTTSDVFEKVDLSEEVLDTLRSRLRAIPELKKCILVRKRVIHLPHRPFYVLGFKLELIGISEEKMEAMAKRIYESVEFPGQTSLIPLHADFRPFEHVFEESGGTILL